MNTSVAVGLEGDNFSKSLQRLTQELGITGHDLVMFMSGPVAVRLVDASIAKPPHDWIRSSASPQGPGHVHE